MRAAAPVRAARSKLPDDHSHCFAIAAMVRNMENGMVKTILFCGSHVSDLQSSEAVLKKEIQELQEKLKAAPPPPPPGTTPPTRADLAPTWDHLAVKLIKMGQKREKWAT